MIYLLVTDVALLVTGLLVGRWTMKGKVRRPRTEQELARELALTLIRAGKIRRA